MLYGSDIDEDELEFAFDWDYIEQRGGPGRASKLIADKDIQIKDYLAPFYLRGNPEGSAASAARMRKASEWQDGKNTATSIAA